MRLRERVRATPTGFRFGRINSNEGFRRMSTDFTGITVENILLLDCKIAYHGAKEKQSYCLALTSLQRTEEAAGKSLFVRATFDLMHGIVDPACTLKCTFAAIYSKPEGSGVSWSEFGDGLAVAHMVPFVREFIASTTNRMPLPPLMLRPVNAFVLVEKYQKRQAEKAAEAKPVAP